MGRPCRAGSVLSALTDEGVCDVGPVDAVLQLQLVVGLDVEQQVLVKAHPSDQVGPVGTLQSTAAVDMLRRTEAQREYSLCTEVCGCPAESKNHSTP